MRMDLTVTDYPDRAALDEYMHGSAELIGLQVLPVLGTVGDPAAAVHRPRGAGGASCPTRRHPRDLLFRRSWGGVVAPGVKVLCRNSAHAVRRNLDRIEDAEFEVFARAGAVMAAAAAR